MNRSYQRPFDPTKSEIETHAPPIKSFDSDRSQSTHWQTYDTIARFLVVNGFHLTALEFYTELLENGDDQPYLRDHFGLVSESDNEISSKSHRRTIEQDPQTQITFTDSSSNRRKGTNRSHDWLNPMNCRVTRTFPSERSIVSTRKSR
jgi:hypothetical protein